MKGISRRILLLMNGAGACLYLLASIANHAASVSPNRVLASSLAFVYFLIMFVGLYKFPRPFSVFSLISFGAGLAFVLAMISHSSNLSDIPTFLLIVSALGVFGVVLSINTFRASSSKNERLRNN